MFHWSTVKKSGRFNGRKKKEDTFMRALFCIERDSLSAPRCSLFGHQILDGAVVIIAFVLDSVVLLTQHTNKIAVQAEIATKKLPHGNCRSQQKPLSAP